MISRTLVPLPAHLEGLEPYQPGLSIDEVRRRSGSSRVIKLASNENALGPSPRAIEALQGGLSVLHRYPDGPARDLREALAGRHGVAAQQIVIGNGSTELLDLLARAFLDASDNAVASQGAFARFRQVVQARNRGARLVPMRAGRQDLAALAEAVDERTRLLYVANPNNPTGTWSPRAELEALLDRLPPGVLVVWDEAYFEFADEPDYPDGLDYVRAGAPLVVLRTFSKVYGLAGLRVGYAVAAPEVVAAVDVVREPFNSNSLGQLAALAALDDATHVERSVALVRSERPRMMEELRRLGLDVLSGLGNFVFADTRRAAGSVFQALLGRGVIVRPLEEYGFPSALRISLGTREENDLLLESLESALRPDGS